MNTLSIGKRHTLWITNIRKITANFNLCKNPLFNWIQGILDPSAMDLPKINASIL